MPGPIPADYVKNYDGDTVTVRCRIWPGHVVTTDVRLAGVDTPEIRGDCPREKALARKARAFVQQTLESAELIALRDIRQGKYAGRVVGRLVVGGEPLSELLIAARLGRPYDGGGRES